MTPADFIKAMPKVELHVHLEGSVRPETLLKLAKKHHVTLPADDLEGIRKWYTFRDFPHFVDIYLKITECIKTIEDFEQIAREFLDGQAAQNIRYTEVTTTSFLHYYEKGMGFDEQMAALNRARAYARETHGIDMQFIIDIPRNMVKPDESMMIAEWAVSGMNDGVIALGLGGAEVGHPPEDFTAAFDYARQHNLASIPHAGETEGAASVWGAIHLLGAVRIGHGVRAIEDPVLIDYLRDNQIPLEVNPTSNVCLRVVPNLQAHMLPKLMDAGVYVTINSDDPPMFNTNLTDEYLQTASTFGFDTDTIKTLVMNAVHATILPDAERQSMAIVFESEFAHLQNEFLSE